MGGGYDKPSVKGELTGHVVNALVWTPRTFALYSAAIDFWSLGCIFATHDQVNAPTFLDTALLPAHLVSRFRLTTRPPPRKMDSQSWPTRPAQCYLQCPRTSPQ
eukprot:TRINITY_DN2189_c0_g4_i1.p3 TRINITY_DN2189_c0_g4~~TRINITY_DN2189_c0_g4_i1.p3  ORF type:complete len:104 (-),score=4.08 TRINITY_DN2189_c0_g4_i1:357-668(-)